MQNPPASHGDTSYLVYHWRNLHDYLWFKTAAGRVVEAAWYSALD